MAQRRGEKAAAASWTIGHEEDDIPRQSAERPDLADLGELSGRGLFTRFRYGTSATPVTALVVPAVGQPDAAERDVAYHQVERAFGSTGNSERLVADVRARVQSRHDLRGDGLQLYAGELRAGGGEADEVPDAAARSEEHTSELQSRVELVCRLLLDK